MVRIRDLLAEGLLLALPLGALLYLLHKTVGVLKQLLVPVAHLLPNGSWIGIAAIEIAAVLLLLIALVMLGAFALSKLGRKVVMVVGSEGKGMRPKVANNCDALVSIPQRGKVDSLNVSTATAVLLYAVLQGRMQKKD